MTNPSPHTEKMKAIHAFLPISRVNDEERTVEAYGFVNETVQGEGGIRLKRTSMEAATPDYMKWANIREMHDPKKAVGTTSSVKWDEKGAHMTLRVTDDAAWQKVKQGVYKGLSVGVIPQVMRGKDVEKCTWMETSLVDRPADPDAKITVFRADGFDPDAEHDVVVMADTPSTPFLDVGAVYAEQFALIRASALPNREKLARKAVKKLIAAAAPLMDTGKTSDIARTLKETKPVSKKTTPPPDAANAEPSGEVTLLARMETMQTEHTAAIARLEGMFAKKNKKADKIARSAEKQAKESQKTIERLNKAAAPVANPPVLFPAALERNLNPGNPFGSDAGAPDAGKLLEEYKDLLKEGMTPNLPEQRKSDIVDQMAVMKPLLASVGIEV